MTVFVEHLDGLSLNRRAMLAAVALLLTLPASTRAAQATTITWADLVPLAPPLPNFLEELPQAQARAIQDINTWLSFPSGEVGPALAKMRNTAKARAERSKLDLLQQDVDVDALYSRYLEWVKELDARGRASQPRYNGQQVSLAGYLLPLDFDPGGAREFLLVPYVGACIHVPPPPPNQIVLVTTARAHVQSGLFDSVMVTGVMQVEPVTKDLSLVDGSSNVEMTYRIASQTIAPFKDGAGGR